MLRQVSILIIGLVVVPAFIACEVSSNEEVHTAGRPLGHELPNDISDLVFHGSRFAEPVVLSLPDDDRRSKEALERVLARSGGPHGIPYVIPNHGFDRIDKHMLSYLVGHGLVEVDVRRVDWYGGGMTRNYRFLLYSSSFTSLPGIEIVSRSLRNELKVDVARRVVRSIDYTNNYEQVLMGVPLDVWAVRFTYALVNEGALPDFPEITRSFEGSARAYLDPDDGRWKLDALSLEDRRDLEYLEVVRETYPPFQPRLPPPRTEEPELTEAAAPVAGGATRVRGRIALPRQECGQPLPPAGSNAATSIEFSNLTEHPVLIHWVGNEGRPVFYKRLSPGGSYVQRTYASHTWVVTDAGGACMGLYQPTVDPSIVIVRARP